MSSSLRKLRKLRKLRVWGFNSEHRAAEQCVLSVSVCVYIAKGLKKYCNVFLDKHFVIQYDKLLLPNLTIPSLDHKEFVQRQVHL